MTKMSHTVAAVKHPAKFSAEIKDTIVHAFERFNCKGPIYDPFAGVGGVHEIAERLGVSSVGVELESEWAQAYETRIGNGGEFHGTFTGSCLTFDAFGFGTVITSPCYGNRMADHHEARDDSVRHTYRHYLGRPLHADNAGAMQWGPEYRRFHEQAWGVIASRSLNPGGHLILNISDHVRKGKVAQVCQWHVDCLRDKGFVELGSFPVKTRRQRNGANGELRVPCEMVYVLELRYGVG